MHIPDGFLDPGVAAATGVAAGGAVAIGLRRAEATFDERRAPLLGVTAAFVFAAQMLNFPVAGGTSGHFLGAALATILLGPWLACVVLAVVLLVQAFLFADGGVSALGANVLNMGVIGALGAGLVMGVAMRVLPRDAARVPGIGRGRGLAGGRRRLGRVLLRAGDLGDRAARHGAPGDGRRPRADRRGGGGRDGRGGERGPRRAPGPRRGRPARGRARARRAARGGHGMRMRVFVVLAIAVAIGLATAVSPFASSSPDGLQRVAENHGFAGARARPRRADPRLRVPGRPRPAAGQGAGRLRRDAGRVRRRWGLVTLLGRSRRRVVVQ